MEGGAFSIWSTSSSDETTAAWRTSFARTESPEASQSCAGTRVIGDIALIYADAEGYSDKSQFENYCIELDNGTTDINGKLCSEYADVSECEVSDHAHFSSS